MIAASRSSGVMQSEMLFHYKKSTATEA